MNQFDKKQLDALDKLINENALAPQISVDGNKYYFFPIEQGKPNAPPVTVVDHEYACSLISAYREQFGVKKIEVTFCKNQLITAEAIHDFACNHIKIKVYGDR